MPLIKRHKSKAHEKHLSVESRITVLSGLEERGGGGGGGI